MPDVAAVLSCGLFCLLWQVREPRCGRSTSLFAFLHTLAWQVWEPGVPPPPESPPLCFPPTDLFPQQRIAVYRITQRAQQQQQQQQ